MTAGLTNICSTNVPKTTPQPVDLKKKTTKSGPSSLRQILPVALCLFTFATVLSVLVIYMDTTGNFSKKFYIFLYTKMCHRTRRRIKCLFMQKTIKKRK